MKILGLVDDYPHIASLIGWSFKQEPGDDGDCYLLLEHVDGGCVDKSLHRLSEREIVRVCLKAVVCVCFSEV